LIGDSFIALSHDITKDMIAIARDAGALAASDSYRDNSVSGTQLSGGISPQIPVQYANGAKDAPAKVVIMDGGTWDTLVAGGSEASVNSVATTFGQLLSQVASDGTVEHIIYFLTPELPGIAGVAALRPLMQQSCRQSSVPCHFIDLQPFWAGHPEYTTGDLVPIPTEVGATAIADAIWAEMQQRCVAQ